MISTISNLEVCQSSMMSGWQREQCVDGGPEVTKPGAGFGRLLLVLWTASYATPSLGGTLY